MLYAIRKSDNKEFPVWKYIKAFESVNEIYVWCDGLGKVMIGEDYYLTWKPKDFLGIEWGFSFEAYLIKVGEESCDYKFDMEVLMANTDYFRDCYNRHLSAYKAMCFFGLELEEKKSAVDKILDQITPDEQQIVSNRMMLAAKIEDRAQELQLGKKDLAGWLHCSTKKIDQYLSGTVDIPNRDKKKLFIGLGLK